jgi:nicotinate-nucleotide pyrophosphorylase (carboxylating)
MSECGRETDQGGYETQIAMNDQRRDFAQSSWDASTEEDCRQLIRLAIREDLERTYDWTTVALVSPEAEGRAEVVSRGPGVVAGLPAGAMLLDELDTRLRWEPGTVDGSPVAAGQVLGVVSGPARSLLTAERPLLNFIGHLSGVASLTRQYVEAVAGTGARLYDTRKTTPGWRRLEKYAVRMGGGHNHRTGLFDAVLIKDNHLALGAAAAGAAHYTPAAAVRIAREFIGRLPASEPAGGMIVEVEVDNLSQYAEILAAAAAEGAIATPDIVLLDNMSLHDLCRAVARRDAEAPGIELEASGGVNLDTIGLIAQTGVDRISVGALTHSAVWFDIGLDWR